MISVASAPLMYLLGVSIPLPERLFQIALVRLDTVLLADGDDDLISDTEIKEFHHFRWDRQLSFFRYGCWEIH